MSGRNTQVSRILKIMHLLEITPQGYTVTELASRLKDFDFSEQDRTIRRDLEVIEQFFPLVREEVDGQRDKRFRLESVAKITKNVSFSVEELIALYLSKESMNSFASSPLFQHIKSFYEKLEKVLGYKAVGHLREIKEKVHYSPIASWQSSVPQEIFDTVYRACEEGHIVEVLYSSLNSLEKKEPTFRKLGPEGIYFGNGGAYLIAQDLGDEEVKIFSLSRIREAKWTDESYNAKNVDVAAMLEGGIGVLQMGTSDEVTIHVREPMASYVAERRWHKSQTIVRTQDGVVLKMNVKINDELARWVLSLGTHATVVGPQELKLTVAKFSEEIAQSYRSKQAG